MSSDNSSPLNINLSHLLPALQHALSGSAGTAISTCATYPLSLVVTRLQVQRQLRREGKLAREDECAGIFDAFSRVWREGRDQQPAAAVTGPLRAFYTGLTQDTAKSILDSFLFFMFYEWFRGLARRRRSRLVAATTAAGGKQGLKVWEELAVGMAAGACSRFFTAPISNVVTRKQTASLVDDDADNITVRQIVEQIRREKGITGFWSGYSASLVLTLNPSLTFFLQDFLKKLVLSEDRWENPGPQFTFLLAASSKAIASTITYPFQIAKSRMQVSMPTEADSEPQEENASASQEGNVEKQVEKKLESLRTIRQFAKNNIFSSILQIARTEGVGALYDGVQGELLKGFLSHGTTMLAKDVIHKFIFQLYFTILTLVKQIQANPSSLSNQPSKISAAFRTKLSEAGNSSIKAGEDVISHGRETFANVLGKITTKIESE